MDNTNGLQPCPACGSKRIHWSERIPSGRGVFMERPGCLDCNTWFWPLQYIDLPKGTVNA